MGNWKDEIRKLEPIALKAVLIAGIMFYPIGLLHESGHALICTSQNGSFSWNDFLLLAVRCSPSLPPESFMLYWSLGGIFGMIGGSVFLISKKVRMDKPILIGVLLIVFSQFVNFFFETFAHFAYLNSFVLGMLMLTILTLFFFGLLMFFRPDSKSKT